MIQPAPEQSKERGPTAHRYTHGHHESVLRSHQWRTAENSAAYLLPWLRPGYALLDVGCGPGTITVDLARRLGTGHAVGVDNADGVIEVARATAAEAGGANVRFAVDDVLGSKLEGAAWAAARWPDTAVIDAAVALRHGEQAELDEAAVDALLSSVAAQLREAAG